MEAIFIGIYVYGWDRLSPRAHLAERHPDRDRRLHRLADGHLRQRVDEPPRRVSARRRQGRRRPPAEGAVRQQLPLARADPHVRRRLHRHRLPRRRRLRVRPAARPLGPLRAHGARDPADDRRARLAACRSSSATGPRATSPTQPIKLAAIEGLYADDRGAPRAPARLVHRRPGQIRDRDPAPAVAARVPQLERDGPGARRRAARTTGRPSTSCGSRSRRWSGSGRCSRCSGSCTCSSGCGAGACPNRSGSTARSCSPGPLALVALIAGWVTTEVGRQPWVVYRVMPTSQAVTGARRDPGRLRDAGARLPRRRVRPSPGSCAGSRAARSSVGGAEPSPTPASRVSRCSCTSLPLVFVLAGLVALHGARRAPTSAPASGSCSPDAGERAERDPRPRPRFDGARVGGQPRVADLRADRVLDGLPERVRRRSPRRSRSRCSSPRSGSSSAAPRTRCEPEPRAARESARDRHGVLRSPRSSPRSRSAPRSARSPPTACRSATPPAHLLLELAEPDVDHHRRARRRERRVPRRRLPRRRRGRLGGHDALEREFRLRALAAGVVAGAIAVADLIVLTGRPPARARAAARARRSPR